MLTVSERGGRRDPSAFSVPWKFHLLYRETFDDDDDDDQMHLLNM